MKGSPGAADAQAAYLAGREQIAPGLVVDTERAIGLAENICLDIEHGKDGATVVNKAQSVPEDFMCVDEFHAECLEFGPGKADDLAGPVLTRAVTCELLRRRPVEGDEVEQVGGYRMNRLRRRRGAIASRRRRRRVLGTNRPQVARGDSLKLSTHMIVVSTRLVTVPVACSAKFITRGCTTACCLTLSRASAVPLGHLHGRHTAVRNPW